jgi:hypothetical protein
VYQCSVKLTRDGDKDIRSVVLSDWKNEDHFVKEFELKNNGDTYLMKELPQILQIKRTGTFGSKFECFYASTQTIGQNINEFQKVAARPQMLVTRTGFAISSPMEQTRISMSVGFRVTGTPIASKSLVQALGA